MPSVWSQKVCGRLLVPGCPHMSRGVPTSVLPCLRLTSPFLSIVNANCPSLDHVEVAGRLRTMAHARTGSY